MKRLALDLPAAWGSVEENGGRRITAPGAVLVVVEPHPLSGDLEGPGDRESRKTRLGWPYEVIRTDGQWVARYRFLEYAAEILVTWQGGDPAAIDALLDSAAPEWNEPAACVHDLLLGLEIT